MELSIKKTIPINRNDCVKIGEFLYNRKEDSIFFELPFPFPLQLKLTHHRFEHTHQTTWLVEATPAFMKLPTIMRGHININILCRELDVLEYLQQGKLMLHASCYEHTDHGELRGGILNVGFQNTGKTYNTYRAVAAGASLISEEYTIIDEEFRACPYKEMVRSCLSKKTLDDCSIGMEPIEYIWLFFKTILAKLMPFMFEAAIWKDFPVSEIIAQVKEVRMYNKPIKEKLYEKLVLLTENEFPFMAEDILQAYAFASGYNLIWMQDQQRQLIKRFANHIMRR